MSALSSWSKTAASNTSPAPDGWPTGMLPSQVEPTAREMMAQIRSTAIPLQIASQETGTLATGTTSLPFDNTIPQSTEGDQYLSLTITPKATTSTLVIDVVLNISSSAAAGTFTAALFQDAGANAIAASAAAIPGVSGSLINIRLRHVMAAGTTSATTFKVRAGSSGAGTTTFNGSLGGGSLAGVMASSITITEYLA